VGTARGGLTGIGNEDSGVAIVAQKTVVGALANSDNSGGNRIAFNRGYGVLISDSAASGNTVRGNAIYGNAKLGINLSPKSEVDNTVTANDVQDADSGPNSLQNFPVLTDVNLTGSVLTLHGTLNSTPNHRYVVDIYCNRQQDISGYGQGEVYVGHQSVGTDEAGNGSFALTLSGNYNGQFITATATDLSTGDTSEFSQATPVQTLLTGHINGVSLTSAASGTRITINGSNLDTASSVKFAGTPAQIASATTTQLQVTVPVGAASGPITVTTATGTITGPTFHVITPPIVSSFNPNSGRAGTPITINGSNFTAGSIVKFNGLTAVSHVVSATQIQATVPVAVSNGTITVTTTGGTANSLTNFIVQVPPPALPTVNGFVPTSGAPGTQVTIQGTNLTGTRQVKFSGLLAPMFSITANQVIVAVPQGAVSGKIVIVNSSGNSVTSSTPFVVPPAERLKPIIYTFDPTAGSPETVVRITGRNFTPDSQVRFNSQLAELKSQSATELQAKVPHGIITAKLSVKTSVGITSAPGMFTVPVPVAQPRVDGWEPYNSDGIKVGTLITIHGANFQNM